MAIRKSPFGQQLDALNRIGSDARTRVGPENVPSKIGHYHSRRRTAEHVKHLDSGLRRHSRCRGGSQFGLHVGRHCLCGKRVVDIFRADAVGKLHCSLHVIGSAPQHARDKDAYRATVFGRRLCPRVRSIGGVFAKAHRELPGKGSVIV